MYFAVSAGGALFRVYRIAPPSESHANTHEMRDLVVLHSADIRFRLSFQFCQRTTKLKVTTKSNEIG